MLECAYSMQLVELDIEARKVLVQKSRLRELQCRHKNQVEKDIYLHKSLSNYQQKVLKDISVYTG